jgi:hypothetical protein
VIAATRLRAGNCGSARSATSMIAEMITTARPHLRRDGPKSWSAPTRRSTPRSSSPPAVAGRCGFVTTRIDAKTRAACDSIGQDQRIDIKYPQAVRHDDDERWISDAQIAETGYTGSGLVKRYPAGSHRSLRYPAHRIRSPPCR